MRASALGKFCRGYVFFYIAFAALIVAKHGAERGDTLTLAFAVSGVFALFVASRLCDPLPRSTTHATRSAGTR